MKADLHCHSRLSDGTLGIEDIIQLAIKNGLDAISITDHDCLAGNTRAKVLGERNGIKVVSGVEISATDTETNSIANILAYKSTYPNRLEGICHKNSTARKRAGQYMMIKAAKRFNISSELVMKCSSGSTNLYVQHIMHALMECGYTTDLFGELYESLFMLDSPDNIFVAPKFAPVEEVIALIHESEGIAVLPYASVKDNISLIERLIPLGIDGIEVWHPDAAEDVQNQLIEIAKKHGLLMTGGSNFHGFYNQNQVLLGDYGTPKKNFDELMAYKARKKRQQRKAKLAEAADSKK